MFRWQLMSSVYLTALQLVVMVYLGKLLGYQQLGVYAVFQIIFRLALALLEPGMFVSAIQRIELTPRIFGRLSRLQFFTGLTGIVLIASFYVIESKYWYENSFVAIMALLLFGTIAVGSRYTSMLTRMLRQRELGIAQISGATAEFIVILGLLRTFEPLSIFTVALFIRFLIYYLMAYGYYHRIKTSCFTISNHEINDEKDHIRFSSYQMVNQGLSFIQGNFDSVLIISMFGLSVLGPYNLSSELCYLLFSKINPIFNKAVFPVLARHQQDDLERQDILRESALSHALVCISLYVIVYVHLQDLIPMVFQDPEGKVLLFSKFICLMAMIRSVNNFTFNNLLALGESRNLLRWNVFILLFNYAFIATIIFLKTSVVTFLLINIFVSLFVLIFSICKLGKYYINKQLLVKDIYTYLLCLLTGITTLFFIRWVSPNVWISFFGGISSLMFILLIFYRKKMIRLFQLRIL